MNDRRKSCQRIFTFAFEGVGHLFATTLIDLPRSTRSLNFISVVGKFVSGVVRVVDIKIEVRKLAGITRYRIDDERVLLGNGDDLTKTLAIKLVRFDSFCVFVSHFEFRGYVNFFKFVSISFLC